VRDPRAASEQSAAAGDEPSYRLALGLQGSWRGWRGELAILAGIVLATCLLTWPMVATLERATGTRPDYLNNLWNGWWLKHALGEHVSPFWSDYLYYPEGISLRRHTLSPLNSGAMAALMGVFGAHQAFSLVVLAHFALSAWCFSLLARYVTGSTAGGVLGGLVYSFCPFHYFYLCQVNVFSFEFLPLALLFLLRYLREGGRRNLAGVVLALAGLAATVEYFVVYALLALALLLACARGWARGVPWPLVARRILRAGALGGVAVALVAAPLLLGALLEPKRALALDPADGFEKSRFNDLLGFFWIGGDEECTVSWPTMLGYSTLAVLCLGWRGVRAHWPWVVLGVAFLLLSLGGELAIGREKTGIPLPYALFGKLPVLSMLRKSDRCYMMVQLAACVALAAAWRALAARLGGGGRARLAWACTAGLTLTELTGVPFQRFEIEASPGLAALRAEHEVSAVMELPPMPLHTMNGRYLYFQMLHEKKATLGYTTSLALQGHHDQRLQTLANLYLQFILERNAALPRLAATLGVDRVLHYKSIYGPRPIEPAIHGRTLWKPFFFLRRPLVFVRQVGEYALQPYGPETWARIRLLLARALGEPLFEDEFLAVFPVPR
jgi:hypothetical protein